MSPNSTGRRSTNSDEGHLTSADRPVVHQEGGRRCTQTFQHARKSSQDKTSVLTSGSFFNNPDAGRFRLLLVLRNFLPSGATAKNTNTIAHLTLMVRSAEHAATHVPSGWKRAWDTDPSWSKNVRRQSWVCTSHSLTALSSPQEVASRESGLIFVLGRVLVR